MEDRDQELTLYQIARNSLARWGISEDSRLELISHSENAVFSLTRPDGWRKILRVHRTGYHSSDGVRSELAWMQALQQEAAVETPQAVPGLDGDLIQHVSLDSGQEPRMVVLFDFITGTEPRPDDLLGAFRHLGSIAARMHAHARSWHRPAYFERLVWDYDSALGSRPNWGGWQDGFAPDKAGREIIVRADAVMRDRLNRFGTHPGRFGLIHSDLRLANLLVHDGRTKVLDFDDCGLGWFLYDIASSMTFLENHPESASIISAWIEGYRMIGALEDEDIAEIPTFMMLRRLVIMGWAGSHPNTELAKDMGDEYTVGTVQFAEKYLSIFVNDCSV